MASKEIEKRKAEHRNAGPYKNALEAIKSPTFSAMHKAVKHSQKTKSKHNALMAKVDAPNSKGLDIKR
jgi:hypothetical protein